MDNNAQNKQFTDVCGQCRGGFFSEKSYLEHVCKATNTTPADPANLGPEFEAISKAAQERGQAIKDLEAQGVPHEEAVKQTRDIGKVVA